MCDRLVGAEVADDAEAVLVPRAGDGSSIYIATGVSILGKVGILGAAPRGRGDERGPRNSRAFTRGHGCRVEIETASRTPKIRTFRRARGAWTREAWS